MGTASQGQSPRSSTGSKHKHRLYVPKYSSLQPVKPAPGTTVHLHASSALNSRSQLPSKETTSPPVNTIDTAEPASSHQQHVPHLLSTDILGDVELFKAQHAARLQQEQASANTVITEEEETPIDLDTAGLPAEILELARLAPDGGRAIYNAHQDIKRDRDIKAQQAQALKHARENYDYEVLYQLPRKVWEKNPLAQNAVLEKFHRQLEVWKQAKKEIKRRARRPTQDLTMSDTRAMEWRIRRELVTLLDTASPDDQDMGFSGPEIWMMSLRDSWTRYVPLGNIFSGLFVEISWNTTQSRKGALVKRLVADDCSEEEAEDDGTCPRTLPARHRAWLDSKYLAQKVEHNKASQEGLQYDPEPLLVEGLACERAIAREAALPITLPDIEKRLRAAGPAALGTLQAAQAEAARLAGESAATRAAVEKAASERWARWHPEGPWLDASPSRVWISCGAGEVASRCLRLTNCGTVPLRYELLPRLLLGPNQAQDMFFCQDLCGVSRPGETIEIRWFFKARKPGMFSEVWNLVTEPPLPAACNLATITVQGVASVYTSELKPGRRRMEQALAQREMQRQVHTAVERIVDDVTTPPCAPREPPQLPGEAEQQFAVWNTERAPAVFYDPEVYAALGELYAAANALLPPPTPPPEAPVPTPKKGAKDKEPPPPPPKPATPEPPPQWNGSIAELSALLEALAQKDPRAAAPLQRRLAGLLTACQIPFAHMQMHSQAVRSVLVGMLDKVEPMAERLMATCVEREQKRAAAAAEAAAEAGQPAVVEPPKPAPPAKKDKPKGKGKEAEEAKPEPEAPPPPAYDPVEFHKGLKNAFRNLLGHAAGELEPAIGQEYGRVAQLLEARLHAAESRAEAAGKDPEERAAALWDSFAVLRTWEALKLPTAAAQQQPPPHFLRESFME